MDWNKVFRDMAYASLGIKQIPVRYEEKETKVIVMKADYFKGYEVFFYEPKTEEVPF